MEIETIIRNRETVLAKTIQDSMASETPAELRPVWRVFPNFRCPVIGSCMSVEEQKKIIKKTGFFKKDMSAFQIHHTVMEHLDNENPVSIKADRYIRHKYRNSIEKFKSQSEDKLRDAWDSVLETGELEGLFYVVATRPDISNEFMMKAFGDIHMLGHSNMSDLLKLRKDLALKLDVNEKLAGRLNEEKTRTRQANARNKNSLKKVNELEKEASLFKKQLNSVSPEETAALKQENESLKKEIRAMKTRLALTEEENSLNKKARQRLELRQSELKSTNKLLKQEIQDLMGLRVENCPVACDRCKAGFCDVCAKCSKKVLMIGGMTKMKPYYKNIVESKGDEFLYHDGYMKSGSKQLKNLVYGSDLVLCPVNCNSHNACLRIKKLCKQFNKPIKMMPSSSLSSLSLVLNGKNAGKSNSNENQHSLYC